MTLRKNISALFAIQALAYVVPLATLPYLARVLGGDQFGRMTFALASVQYFVLLTEYGFNLSASRRAALLLQDRPGLTRLVASVTAARAFICIAGAGIMLILTSVLPPLAGDPALYFVAYLSVVGQAALPMWLLQGLGRIHVATLSLVAAQLVALSAMLGFVRGPADYLIATMVQASAPLLASVGCWCYLWRGRHVGVSRPTMEDIQVDLREGWPLFVSNASVHLYTTSNIVVLGLLSGPHAVGMFSAAEKIVRAVAALMTPISQSVYPHIARLSMQSQTTALNFIRKLFWGQGAIMCMLSPLLFMSAEPLVRLLFGHGYADGADILRWLAVLPLLVGVSNVLGVQTMLNFGLQGAFGRIVLACGLVNLVLLVVLVPRFGGLGAAASVVVIELAVVFAMSAVLARAGLLSSVLRRTAA